MATTATAEEVYLDQVATIIDALLTGNHSDIPPTLLSLQQPTDNSNTPPQQPEQKQQQSQQSQQSPSISKVDLALSSLVQKILLIEADLARLRLEQKANATITTTEKVENHIQQRAPLILTPPVDILSPPISTSNRWATSAEGDAASTTWDFMNDNSTSYPSPYSAHPSSSIDLDGPSTTPSIHSYSDATSLSGSSQNSSSDSSTGVMPLPAPLPPPPPTPLTSSSLPTTSSLNIPHSHHHQHRSLSPLSSSYESVGGGMSPYLGFHPGELSNSSRPSSPDSFNSALSSFPLDLLPELAVSPATPAASVLTPGLPTQGPGLPSSEPSALVLSALSFSGADLPSEEVPCAACIHHCALVAAAVVQGDLSLRITCDRPACNQSFLATSINAMVAKLSNFTEEVIRVAAQGVEGKLGVQANMEDEHGIWKEFVSHLNTMTVGHSEQVRDIASVCTAVAHGDLSQKITVAVKGETLVLKNTINTMVDQLRSFSSEVTRVAHEVGTEGKLGGQALVGGVDGTWKELTDNVNTMASNLTTQVRSIAEVTTAVACGDLSKTIDVQAQGEISELKLTVNSMVEQLRTFAAEVTRVAREVGTEGKLGGQAEVKDVGGTWRELTENVNTMAANLTTQVRDIADVSKAVAKGDLSKKITVEVKGEMMDLKHTINTMVDQLQEFATEVSRVSLEVGTEGKLGGQAHVKDVSGTWKELTDNVNLMASNLTGQVRDIADVCKAVACGDLTKKVSVPVQGEILELKETMNTMVDQLRTFAAEVTRVAREVGTEGKLGGQAHVKDVSGTWKELTDNVNLMASNLTTQVRSIAEVTTAVACGDLSKKIDVQAQGEISELKKTVNSMVEQLRTFAAEVTRVSLEVGTEGKLGGQATVKDVSGTWKELTDNVNTMASNLTTQVRSIAEVTTAVACGDLSKKIDVQAQGEISELKHTINSMVEQLRTFAAEVTRVAREVGTEGILGGQAEVKGVDGTWKELTDNVNTMASNLTTQVRSIAEVTTAVACGDLSKTIDVQAQGEISELKKTVNSMVEQLRTFAAEVTRVAREVGTEGILGGQAEVKGVDGTWKELTDNVNTMASNLTTQ
ncbi:hypothetical protein BGZ88_002961, partial [Linnemannia elongata]